MVPEFLVKDSPKRCLKFWQQLAPQPWVLDVIANGYALPFNPDLQMPNLSLPNNQSARDHCSFVEEEISALVASGAVKQVVRRPHVVSPLSVATNSSKLRLILDLSRLNQYLDISSVKYETLDTIVDLLPKGGFLGKFDMKAGYHHINIADNYHSYLGFSWDFGAGPRYFVFTVLPFGLAPAPYVFTKVFRPLINSWRAKGILCALYLDDGIFAARCLMTALTVSSFIQEELRLAGVITSPGKCVWFPVAALDWLGILIDLHRFLIRITTKRVSSTLETCNRLLQERRPTVRQRMQLTGKLISMAVVLGPIVQLKTRRLYQQINSAIPSYNRRLLLSPEETGEIAFWLRNLSEMNVRSLQGRAGAARLVSNFTAPGDIKVSEVAPTKRSNDYASHDRVGTASNSVHCLRGSQSSFCQQTVATDASATGAGAILIDHSGQKNVATAVFNDTEAAQSSTYRELKTVLFALHSFQSFLCNRRVKIQTDNTGVVAVVRKGSNKPELQTLAEEIFQFSVQYKCTLEPIWVPRNLNTEADEASRIVDYDDWGVRDVFFRLCDRRWGPHTVDRFADHRNAKCDRFNSKFHVPGSEAVDSFGCNWQTEMNWLCPPISQVARTVKHLAECQARGTLAIPEWQSKPFFTLLRRDGNWAPGVRDRIRFPSGTRLFNNAAQETSVFNASFSQSPFLFLLLDYSSPPGL